MDFRTRIGEQSFGVRASALIIKDEKIYLAKSPKNEYYLLGGAILVNELTEDAIIREMKEELNIDIEVKQLAFVVENQFSLDLTKHHQIEFLYLVNPLSDLNKEIYEGGQKRMCEWISFEELSKINLNPSFLKITLKNWNGQVKHFVNKNKEK